MYTIYIYKSCDKHVLYQCTMSFSCHQMVKYSKIDACGAYLEQGCLEGCLTMVYICFPAFLKELRNFLLHVFLSFVPQLFVSQPFPSLQVRILPQLFGRLVNCPFHIGLPICLSRFPGLKLSHERSLSETAVQAFKL